MGRITQAGSPLAVAAVLAAGCGGASESRKADAETGAADSAASAAAGRSAEVRVSNVMIGRHISTDNRITQPTFEFAPGDTVHLSVATEGTGGATTLVAAWRSQTGEVLEQSTATVGADGKNAAFHLAQPKGLKPGTYKVILFLGEDSVETKVFVVKK